MMDRRIGKHGERPPVYTISGAHNRPPMAMTRSLGNGYYVVVDTNLPREYDLEAEIEKLRGEVPKEKHEPKRKPASVKTGNEDSDNM